MADTFPLHRLPLNRQFRWLGALLALALIAVAGQAQTFRGAINGTVTDQTGAVIPNAEVKATEVATGIVHSTTTTSAGQFDFQDIPLGAYKVEVVAHGFAPTTVDKVGVIAGTIFTLPLKLSVTEASTVVEVSAASVALDTTTETQNMTLPSDVVQNAPMNGRDFTQLIAVAPGYGGYSVGGYGSLNGTRPNQMNWQIDGVDNNDLWHNIPAVNQGGVSGIAGTVLPVDAIDEFSAQTQSNAEAGRNAGGTVNLAIKSGTNTLHGSAYMYNRNEFYSAASPFFQPSDTVPKSPPLRNINYGGSVGGPIIKNKTFYFLTFEKQQYIIGLSGKATEPSDAYIAEAMDVLNNPGHKYGNYNPVTPSSLSQNLIGPNGFWPRNLIGGLAGTPDNFFSPVASTGYSFNGVGRIDHSFTDNEHLSVRFFGGQGSQTAPTGGSPALGTASSNLPYYFEKAPLHVYNTSVVLNSVLTNRLSNQVLFGVNYFNQTFSDANNSFNTKALGLFLSPDATNAGSYILGAPNVAISGFEQIGITPPEGRNDVTGVLSDIVSYVFGNHQMRFGGEVRQGRVNEFYRRRGTGAFNFDGSQGDQTQGDPINGYTWASTNAAVCNTMCQTLDPNIKALADYLIGSVASSSIAVGNPERFVTVNAFDFFVQDAWQATKRLNVNVGLRYEYFGPLHSSRNDLGVFTPATGLQIQGVGIDSIFPPDRNNFAPRFGFAYQAKEDMVLRGGIGVFYDQINMNPFLDFRPPLSGAADGLQDNPIGPDPHTNYSLDKYNWQTVQAGGAAIFPGAQTCPSLNYKNASGTECGLATATAGVPDYSLGANLFNVYAVNQHFVAPYFYNYNLQVEKGLGKAGVLQVGYVGSAGHKLSVMTNINAPDPGNPMSLGPKWGDYNTTYPNVGSILQLNSAGTSNYNSLQTLFRLRGWHGLNAQVGYTWSHTLDEVSEYRAVIADNPSNLSADYGNGDYDTRHLLTVNFDYQIPGSSWGPKILTHGWEVSSLWNFHSGQPYDEVLSGLYTDGSNPFSGVSHSFSAANGGEVWINGAAFCAAPTGSCDQPVSRNKYHGPGFADVDLSVIKNIPIRERLRLQLRADIFNMLNRVNLASGPGSVSTSCSTDPTTGRCGSGFGNVSDTIGDFNGAPGIGPGEAFNMQLVAKIIF
jgi:hypothetical protein